MSTGDDQYENHTLFNLLKLNYDVSLRVGDSLFILRNHYVTLWLERSLCMKTFLNT